jgi:Derlin-2/3
MLRLTPILSSPFMTFLEGMITALCYTATQDLRGQKTTIYFFTVPSQLMPYCLILMKLLSPGGFVYIPLQVAGILAAHMWDFLTRLWPEFGGGRNLLPTPAFMTSLVTTPRVLRRDFGTAIRPREPGASGSSTGVSSGPLPDSWRTRGPGRRLGGE